MKILALEKEVPGVAAAAFRPHLQAEAARVWELQQAGVLREIYFRQDRSDAAEAQRVLETLPLVRERLIAFEVIPLKPYPGLARLFGGNPAR
jgi:hypothetical protein